MVENDQHYHNSGKGELKSERILTILITLLYSTSPASLLPSLLQGGTLAARMKMLSDVSLYFIT